MPETPNWNRFFDSNEGESSTKQLIQSHSYPGKAAPRLLSKRDVARVPADQNAKFPTQDILTNQNEEVERREPMRVTVKQYAHKSTAKQIDKPPKKQKQLNLTQTHKQTSEC